MKNYEFWVDGILEYQDFFPNNGEASTFLKKYYHNHKLGTAVVLCTTVIGKLPKPLFLFKKIKTKIVKLPLHDTDVLELFSNQVRDRKKGGKPKKGDSHCVSISFSILPEKKDLFIAYAKKFTDSNSSALFEKIFDNWIEQQSEVIE